MKTANRLPLNVIRTDLETCGFNLTDSQFNELSPKELKAIHRKAQKVRRMTNAIWDKVIDPIETAEDVF